MGALSRDTQGREGSSILFIISLISFDVVLPMSMVYLHVTISLCVMSEAINLTMV